MSRSNLHRTSGLEGHLYEVDSVQRGAREDLAIIRLEQLYPLDGELLRGTFAPYSSAEGVWVQEEPSNIGAWRYLQMTFAGTFARSISRPESANPATGSPGSHKREQRQIIESTRSE